MNARAQHVCTYSHTALVFLSPPHNILTWGWRRSNSGGGDGGSFLHQLPRKGARAQVGFKACGLRTPEGLGFIGFRVQGSGFGFRVWHCGFRVYWGLIHSPKFQLPAVIVGPGLYHTSSWRDCRSLEGMRARQAVARSAATKGFRV